jgi:hypothetical protein
MRRSIPLSAVIGLVATLGLTGYALAGDHHDAGSCSAAITQDLENDTNSATPGPAPTTSCSNISRLQSMAATLCSQFPAACGAGSPVSNLQTEISATTGQDTAPGTDPTASPAWTDPAGATGPVTATVQADNNSAVMHTIQVVVGCYQRSIRTRSAVVDLPDVAPGTTAQGTVGNWQSTAAPTGGGPVQCRADTVAHLP